MLQLTRFDNIPLLTMVVNNKINSEPDFSRIFQSGFGHEPLRHLKLFFCGHFTY